MYGTYASGYCALSAGEWLGMESNNLVEGWAPHSETPSSFLVEAMRTATDDLKRTCSVGSIP